MTSPAELMDLAVRWGREVGELIRDGRSRGVDVAGSKSTITDVVTQMDIAAEQRLRELIAAERPHDAILGEEGGSSSGTSGLTWVLDPIDGTVNYLYDIPVYAVSVAVVEGEPDPAGWSQVAGAVVSAADGRVWAAARGEGAWFADPRWPGTEGAVGRPGTAGAEGPGSGWRRLSINPPRPLAESLVATGFGYAPRRRRQQATTLLGLIEQIRDVRRAGSCAIDLCSVASGQVDAYFERGTMPWDHAAGSLVVTEAGGAFTGLRGRPPGEDMILAGHPATVAALTELLAELRADEGD